MFRPRVFVCFQGCFQCFRAFSPLLTYSCVSPTVAASGRRYCHWNWTEVSAFCLPGQLALACCIFRSSACQSLIQAFQSVGALQARLQLQ